MSDDEWYVLSERLAGQIASEPGLWLQRLTGLLESAAREAKCRCDPHVAGYLWGIQEQMEKMANECSY